MATTRKLLPAGIQTFERIRKENRIYVDKTRYLVDLIDNNTIYFLSRPRRFGKSLTVTTFDAMFSGKKELFKGLYAEEFMNRPDYFASPVIRLDMSRLTLSKGIDGIYESLEKLVRYTADVLKVTVSDTTLPSYLFSELIVNTATKYNSQVVLLIDEYDKPYNEFVNDHETAEKIRGILRDFYTQIKANDEHFRFIFITGISKFARFGIFSGLNNIKDISLDKRYGEMLGLTEKEIVDNFPEYLQDTADSFQISVEELLARMEYFYDGFCFDGIHRLYNPFSTVCFLDEKDFANYWMESGTSKLIADYLKNRNLTVEQFHNFPVTRDFVRTPGDMDTTPPEGFLYQGGYLTVKEGTVSDFMLDYPNTEVLNAMSALLARNILCGSTSFENLNSLVLAALMRDNFDNLVKHLNSLLASIPYDDFTQAANQNIEINGYRFPAQEWLYRSTLLAFFRGCGIATVAEMHTNLGRPDLVLTHRGRTYIIELKVAYKEEDVQIKLDEALQQLSDKNYTQPFPNATGIAIVIDDTKRQIGAYKGTF
jgi:hypothetical protein